MKKLILVAILSSSVFAFAKDIVLSVPDNLFPAETSFSANFDGSINVVNPMLFVAGTYKYLTPSNLGGNTTEIGVCSLLNKKMVTGTMIALQVPTDTVSLNVDGTFAFLFKGNDIYRLETVTCK